jgi:hypothetical protein
MKQKMIKKIVLVLAVGISGFFVLFSPNSTGTILGLLAMILFAAAFSITPKEK